ncbi:HDOD domain-containing protein [Castellaniella sp. FW104-16D08]|uniref:EAL and HDOD domain-containing protein n=2 Tax=Castellaniella TaxID=359336 RepID=UPI00331623FD
METSLMAEQDTPKEQETPPAAPPPFLIRREPVLNKDQGLHGYRLRILWTDPQHPGADAGLAVMQAAREYGINQLLAYAPHWIDATPALLQSTMAVMLPRNRCYLEFPDILDLTPELIQALQGLAHGGLGFSLRGDLAAQPERSSLLPFVKVVGFNSAISTKADIFKQSFQHKQAGRLLLAIDPPDKATLDNFLLLGFTLYAGQWPRDLVAATTLSVRQNTLLNLVSLIMGEGETPEIQRCLEQDSELVKILLDMVNTPAYGLSQEITSLPQAIMLLGRRELQRWIQVLMYTETGRPTGYLSPALIQASARGHFMEALSKQRYPDQAVRAESAFTTGILSVIDQMFNGTMVDLLQQIQLDVPIRDALLHRTGLLGDELRLATLLFPSDRDQTEDLAPLLNNLQQTSSQIAPLVQDAFTWAHGITRAAP